MFHHTEDAKRLLRELKLLKHLGSHTNIVRMADTFHGWAESHAQLNTYIIGSSVSREWNMTVSSVSQISTKFHQATRLSG